MRAAVSSNDAGSSMLNYFVYPSPIGPISIAAQNDALVYLSFGSSSFPGKKAASSLTNKAANQLKEYLAGKRHSFDLPLCIQGSAFQEEVWREVCKIPYGETRSYSEIASAVGSPRAARAVGMANNKNPLPIFIPCHRVVGANGKPVGYAGGLKIKKFLLDLEHANTAPSS